MTALHRVLLAIWLGLLLLPNLTVASLANTWHAPEWQLAAVGCWMAALLWTALPRRLFLVVTFPLLWAGIAVVAADALRGANVLELVAVWYTFRAGEVQAALAPYRLALAATGLALCALIALLWRRPPGPGPRRKQLAAVLVTGAVLAVALPAHSWREAWPAALAGAVLEGQAGDSGIALPDAPDFRASPRPRTASWEARREQPPAAAETYILVIGESVRSDRIPGCGGLPLVTAPPAGALLFCDMLAGSSSTHTSVPLLVSRALPGSRDRVPRDATLLKAFEEVGFETFWLAVQERAIAWPDARNQVYDPAPKLDRAALLPLLDAALARPEPRKLIVLHAYNAHAPYRDRYVGPQAPFPVAGPAHSGEALWNDYDNAIDESMRFLREVAQRLQAQPGEAFLFYTPDHGENLFDDARGLQHHALRVPTLWDTIVPGIAWANAGWRAAHGAKWKTLADNQRAPVMHMDVAPTLLGAAGIRYEEPRRLPVDLTARAVPPRTRFTQVRAGHTMRFETLQAQARAAARPSP
ncbi:sulfatase-like hydrolase/transferase [Caenimonas sedimenti]|uniref:Sulfatase-like hydrolase/transferase n=1 Tax=Caenimonas sedimenti TaxID=2596921 RepID=A0A562ZFB5_9BURK|nr:sulfatase-like hydrolase/transferase [Caenimonas sedimenti]TWO66668.1 sulfatase-like hydrolase/transferase [Caenimonas sedimenti]